MRCPWCGKIEIPTSPKSVLPIKTQFECSHCHKDFITKVNPTPFYLFILCVMLGFLHSYFLMLCCAILVYICFSILHSPYVKAVRTRNSGLAFYRIVSDQRDTFTAQAQDPAQLENIKILNVYPIVKDFDKYPLFSCTSPISILKKDNQQITFFFIYSHPDNQLIKGGDAITLYNEENEQIGSFLFIEHD